MLVKSEACKNLPGFQIDVLTVIAFFVWFSFSQNDTDRWEPGTNDVSLKEGAFLTLTFQLFVSTVFIYSTHSVEMHVKERHPESTDVLKFCQYSFMIYSKLCVDIN